MKRIIRCRIYFIDQLIVVLIILGVIIIIPSMCGYVKWLTIIVELITVLSWGYLCKEILLWPLDMIMGVCEKDVFFSRVSNIRNYEIIREKYYCEWKFYSENGNITLLVPVALTEAEIWNMEKPKVDAKVQVQYYKYSKILKSWEYRE